jgi:glycosyltransferase involved in cell wall biosynthesis
LIQLLRTKNYDAVVVSHEPGVDLLLGLLAKRIARLPLIVDLADPVVTPYTPRWRRQLDLALEAKVLACADTTVVTTEAAAKLLLERHALRGLKRKFACIPQGYPDETEASNVQSDPPAKSLHIVYTGNFYADFRSPVELAAALRELRDLDLSICLYGNHTNFLPIFDGIPGLRLFGVASHRTCLSAQKNCDLLLSMGNRQSFQTPGKIYEYLGAGVPILHLSSAATDEAAILLAKVRAGLVVHNDAKSIAAALREIHTRWTDGTLSAMFSRDEGAIAEFSWRQRSLHYREVIERGMRNAADPCTKSEEEERI